MSKVRRVDYMPDEYISGVGNVLNATEQGVYWMVCSLIMSEGGAIVENHQRIAGLCLIRPSQAKKIIDRLVEVHGKLHRTDGKLSQKRAETEVKRAANRIQTAQKNGAKGGRPPQKSQQNQRGEKAGGSNVEKLTTNYQPPTTNEQHQPKTNSFDDEFAEWYAIYPRREGRGQALKAYREARKKVDAETLLEGARAAQERWGKSERRYIPMPKTWLNGERWADDPASEGDGEGEREQSVKEYIAELDELYRGVLY